MILFVWLLLAIPLFFAIVMGLSLIYWLLVHLWPLLLVGGAAWVLYKVMGRKAR